MSFLWIQRKYVNLVSNQLDLFRQLSENSWRFRCPECGDSKKNRTKCRGNLNVINQEIRYICYNCGIARHFVFFLKERFPVLYREYIRELILEKYPSRRRREPEPVKSSATQNYSIDLPTILSLPIEHAAKRYLLNRKIPEPFLSRFYYAQSFSVWVNSLLPDKLPAHNGDDRIIIPFRDREKNLIGFTGRALENRSIRYITIMLNAKAPKIFGMDTVDETKKIYITEGPFDSTLLPNAIAMAGADFRGYRGTVIYDNERFNEEIVRRMMAVLKKGLDLFIWPRSLANYKDVNDLVLGENITQPELTDLIDTNTVRGSLGYLRIYKWRLP